MGPLEFYREVLVSMTSVFSNLHTVDLGVAESLGTVHGIFVSFADFSEPQEGPVLQPAMEDNLEANVEEGYESESEEDYLNQLRLPSPQSQRRS
jgi:hypothetical protein